MVAVHGQLVDIMVQGQGRLRSYALGPVPAPCENAVHSPCWNPHTVMKHFVNYLVVLCCLGTMAANAHAADVLVVPEPVRLQYDIEGLAQGFPYHAKAELLWRHNGKNYDARMEISHFLLGTAVQTSSGLLGPQGLEPSRFGYQFRNETVVRFERNKNMVTFGSDIPDAPLRAGAQDHLSVFIQIAAMVAGEPGKFPAGTTLPFQAVGPRTSESWTFTVGASEKLDLPGGAVTAIRLWRDPAGENDAKGEIWLAPSMAYLPVRIRLTKGTDEVVDQKWRSTQRP